MIEKPKNYQAIEITYLPPTNYKGARVCLHSLRHGARVCLHSLRHGTRIRYPYGDVFDGTVRAGLAVLAELEFEISGMAEGRNGAEIVFTDDFRDPKDVEADYRKEHGRPSWMAAHEREEKANALTAEEISAARRNLG